MRYLQPLLLILFSCSLFAKTVIVEDFGAQAITPHDNTTAIQNAINSCSDSGGGIVKLENGTYFSGTLEIKDNVSLYIAPGTTLKALADTSKIKKHQSSIYSRLDVVPWKAFIFADSKKNIQIFGGGTIDASGNEQCFRDGVENSPNRHYGLFMINCDNVKVQDVTLTSSAFWMQRYLNCRQVSIHGLTVFNHANKNNDGLDIDSSEDVIVSDCLIDASDDAIVIKSNGTQPARNITITNCIVATHASALKLGTGSVGGFENILISNIIIRRSKSIEMLHPLGIWGGLTGIELLTTDGGPLRQVQISNIAMEDVENPIHMRLGNRLSGNVAKQGYGGGGDKLQGVKGDSQPIDIEPQFVFSDVILENITGKNVGPYPIIIAGHTGHPIKNVALRDVSIHYAKPGSEKDLTPKPYWGANGYPGRGMYGTSLPAYGIVTNFVQNLKMENVNLFPSEGEKRIKEKHY